VMSGSGGGGFGGGGETEISCSSLRIDATISSPKEDVVNKLKAGDFLTVELESQMGTQLVVLKSGGQKAGGITSPNMPRLRACIESGTVFGATVVSRTGAQVQVRIQAIK